jgi:hypothetical protein
MTLKWALNLFKGRIGEAIVEAILSEFGYKVERGGYEQVSSGDDRVVPDLVVTDPTTRKHRYVEVKYRSARPTSVQLDADRITAYRDHYPRTILAVSSAWDGAVYCAQVEDLPLAKDNVSSTLSLLEAYWKPIWHYFPLVKRGERLRRTWRELQRTLSAYGTRQVFGRPDRKLWDGEYEALIRYLEEVWDENLLEHGIGKPEAEKMTLEELWETARHINAVALAEQLLDPSDENLVESPLMLQTVSRALGSRGEQYMTIDLEKLSESIGLSRNDPAIPGLVALISLMIKGQSTSKTGQLAKRLVEQLPDGIGEVYLVDQAVPFQDSERLDLKTAIKLAMNPCRIDR